MAESAAYPVDLTPVAAGDGSLPYQLFVASLFLWPCMSQLACHRWHRLNRSRLFLATEILLFCGSSYFVLQLVLLGQTVAYGAWTFAAAASVYAAITLIQLRRTVS